MLRLPVKYQAEGKRSGLGTYLRAVRKYDIKPTKPVHALDTLFSELKLEGRTEVPVFDQEDDSEYLMEVQIGTPPQTLMLDPDTGSADTWVLSDLLKTSVGKNVNKFNHLASSTFKKLPGETWTITYADSSAASGIIGTDVVSIGSIKVRDQAVELATKASADFVKGPAEGLIGLSWPSLNEAKPKQVPTIVENMIAQGLLDEPIFGVKLVHNDTGEYTFGFYDQCDVLDGLIYTPVDNSSGFWQVKSTIATIGGKCLNRPNKNTAIIDTGTTLMLCDDAFVDAIYAAIPGAKYDAKEGGYLIPANSKCPYVEVSIGHTLFQIPGRAIRWSKISPESDMYYGGIQSRGNVPFDIFGDVFLRHVLAVFDQGQKRFGCARRPDVKYQHE